MRITNDKNRKRKTEKGGKEKDLREQREKEGENKERRERGSGWKEEKEEGRETGWHERGIEKVKGRQKRRKVIEQ